MSERRLTVCLGADDPFALPLAVALRSIEESSHDASRVEVVVLDGGISSFNRERIQRSCPALAIEFLPVRDEHLATLPTSSRVTPTAYARLLLASLLPSHDRVVYLDCDLLAVADLTPLTEVDLGGSVLAATLDQWAPALGMPSGIRFWPDLALDPAAPYLNSGVMVLDLERWRDEHVAERTVEIVERFRDLVRFADQDGLNGLLGGRFTILPPRFNQQTILRTGGSPIWAFAPTDDVQRAIDDPAIVHFAGVRKPWLANGDDPLDQLWFDVLSRTEFADFERPRPPLFGRIERVGRRLAGGARRRWG